MPAYTFRASFDRIADEYRKALEEAGIEDINLEKDIQFFRNITQGTAKRQDKPPGEDDGIKMMMYVISMVGGGSTKKRRTTMRKRRPRRSKNSRRKN